MHKVAGIVIFGAAGAVALGQSLPGPANPKAQASFAEAQKMEKVNLYGNALYYFKKANKQDGGTCLACQQKIAHN